MPGGSQGRPVLLFNLHLDRPHSPLTQYHAPSMALILLGIDEAGYGPLLGPLSVGAAALRAGNWSDGDPAPDFWKLLSKAVCKEPREAKGANPRIPVADSKKLKLANSVTTRHPLVHLERAVLSFMRFAEGAAPDLPADDAALFEVLGVELERRPWYQEVKPVSVPVGSTAQSIAIGSNPLGAALEAASVDCLGLWCRAIGETRFNSVVGETGSKAEATVVAIGEYLRMAFEKWGSGERGDLRVVCDRQGGRTDYGPMLARECRSRADASSRWTAAVKVLEESDRCCRYEVHDRTRRMVVTFMPEAESAHMSVALASMVAKFVRELAMARFNRYWCSRAIESAKIDLKPTAGYRQDAARWLEDARDLLTPDDRRALIRNA